MSDQPFTQRLQSELDAVGAYADELRGAAQGNYDFVVKFLDQQHQLALGNNDEQKAKFIESVSNDVEARVGRIPFDFNQRTDREKQDLSRFYQQQEMASGDQLKREQVFAQQQEFAVGQETRQREQAFSGRGLLDSGLQQGAQQRQEEQRQLFETDPQQRVFALERATRDFGTGTREIESQRRLQDYTTEARRGIQDFEFSQQQRREGAQRDLDQQLARIRAEQQSKEIQTRSIMDQLGQQEILGLA